MKHDPSVTRVRPRRFALAAIPLAVMLATAPASASSRGEPLAGAALKSWISGKRVYLAVPLGGELPLTYRRNGVVDGSGEAAGLGKYMKPKDRGRWWVSGDRLCQKWQEWYDGRTFCFTVAKLPDGRIRWVRDDGKSGIARVR
ncbi:hypothetical protein [Aestuariivirga sp.]|uniref:hypothetical protein n=1 Tax=Aestuariivirga sp. TaxID=2650926 RepID=UPI00391CA598